MSTHTVGSKNKDNLKDKQRQGDACCPYSQQRTNIQKF